MGRVRTFFRPKVQGLFKDFPGLHFEISRTFLSTKLPTAKQNVCVESYVLGINTYTCRNPRRNPRKRESTGNKKTSVFTHSVSNSRILYSVYLKNCLYWLSFNLKLISVDIFRSCSIKKSTTFKDQKPISSTFKALKSDSRNSRVFKGFQGFSRVFKTSTNPGWERGV